MALFARQFSNKWLLLSKISSTSCKKCRFSSSVSSSFSEAFGTVKEALTAIKPNDIPKRVFVGTGQFYEHKTNERAVVLVLGDDDNSKPPLMLLDAPLPGNDIDKLAKEIRSIASVGSVYSGEVDSIQDLPWKFGYVGNPPFSIFSASGFFCQLRHSSSLGGYLRVFDGPLFEDISFPDIEHVQVSLSPEPWEERRLQLKMMNGDLVTVVEDCEERSSSDLALLMLNTEWLVKAGGHLCLLARQGGGTKVQLKLPSMLRADANPWVAMRNKMWAEKSDERRE